MSVLLIVFISFIFNEVSSEITYSPETVTGELCLIPFIYKSRVYHDCTVEDSNRPWCYLDNKFSKWDYCKPKPKEFEGCKLASPNITMEEVNIILAEHNNFRSQMPALRMRKLTWNSELAQRAQAAAESCKHLHVETELCDRDNSMGQNLVYQYYEYRYPNDLSWENVISQWTSEKKFYDMKTGICKDRKICGHFVQAVWDKSFLIGCGKGFCHGNVNGQIAYSIQYYCNYYYSGNVGYLTLPYKEANEKCQNCHMFDEAKKFRCDKDQLCETCDKSMTGCRGMEDIRQAVANGTLCADTEVTCELNAGVCYLLDPKYQLPDQAATFLKKCKKTCKLC